MTSPGRRPTTGGRRDVGPLSHEWIEALRRGGRPPVATIVVATGCTVVWAASLATGGSLLSSTIHGSVDHHLVRNATLIDRGDWWRALTYGTLNLTVYAFVFVMAVLVCAGIQVERTYGTFRFLAVLLPSWTAGALVALLVEPAHANNAGTSGAAFGVATAATIDLLRRGVSWRRTFWIPLIGAVLILGLIFPAGVTWGAHVGGIAAGGLVGLIACRPGRERQRSLGVAAAPVAVVLTAVSLALVTPAARHTVHHGPILIGAPVSRGPDRPGS